jgi:ferredoxin--NADP+ reductase
VIIDPADLALDEDSAAWLESEGASATARRNVEIMRRFAAEPPAGRSHRIVLRFLRSPVEILGSERVEAMRISVNRIEARGARLSAVPTGVQETLECGLVLRSIGYRGVPIPGVPFDAHAGLIRNVDGRVVNESGTVLTGEYAVGWIKRGPSGVIGTNKKCANDTVAEIVADARRGALNGVPAEITGAEILEWVQATVPTAVTWEGWQRIDVHETGRGEPLGRPRVKLVKLDEMNEIARRIAAAQL